MDNTVSERYKIDGFTIESITNNSLYAGKYVRLESDKLQDTQKIIIDNQIDYIEIGSRFTGTDLDFLKDFSFIKGIRFKTGLSGREFKLSNFEGLKFIKNLEFIHCCDNNPHFPTDLTVFNGLKKFSGYSKKKQIFNINIERIDLENLKTEDLSIFSNLSNLKELHLSYSNLITLDGIQFCNKLEVLQLFTCNKITSLSCLESLEKTLKILFICRCRKLNDYEALKHLTKITDLHIADSGNLLSLDFVKKYDNLESAFIYVSVDDEDGTPLKNVKYVSIPKNSNLKNIVSTVYCS